jgi:hypothetical protein
MALKLVILALLTLSVWHAFYTGADQIVSRTESNVETGPTPEPTPEPSMPILKEIVKFKRSAQSGSLQVMVAQANSLLPKYGFAYELDLERIIKNKIKQRKARAVEIEGDGFPYVKFDLEFVTTSGTKKRLAVTAPAEDVCCCGYYYTPIPVTKITPKHLTLVIDTQEVTVMRPADIPVVQEYIFGREQEKPKRLRSWEVPYETYPYGISSNGLKLYVVTEIEELLLEISENGILKFVPKNHPGIVTEGDDLRKLPAPKVGEILHKSGEFGLMRYVLAGKRYILEFPYPCT